MEPIYCPICGETMEKKIGELVCPAIERGLSKTTTEWILRALKNVEPKEPAEIDTKESQYYLCPNCRGELVEYTKFDRYYKCDRCGLELKAMSHFNFEDFERLHKEDPWQE